QLAGRKCRAYQEGSGAARNHPPGFGALELSASIDTNRAAALSRAGLRLSSEPLLGLAAAGLEPGSGFPLWAIVDHVSADGIRTGYAVCRRVGEYCLILAGADLL